MRNVQSVYDKSLEVCKVVIYSMNYIRKVEFKFIKYISSGLHDLEVVILAWKTKNVLGSQKSLKMKNWKHYSKTIVAKHKKSSQNFWEALEQIFQNF